MQKASNYCIYSEALNINNVKAKAIMNEKFLPTQPTLQFVDAPEWYIKGEKQKK